MCGHLFLTRHICRKSRQFQAKMSYFLSKSKPRFTDVVSLTQTRRIFQTKPIVFESNLRVKKERKKQSFYQKIEVTEVSTKVASNCIEFLVVVTKSFETEMFVMCYYAYKNSLDSLYWRRVT